MKNLKPIAAAISMFFFFNDINAQTELLVKSEYGAVKKLTINNDDPERMPKWTSVFLAPGFFVTNDGAVTGKYTFGYRFSDKVQLDTKFIVPYGKGSDFAIAYSKNKLKEISKMTLDLNARIDYELISKLKTKIRNTKIGGVYTTAYMAKIPRIVKVGLGFTGGINYSRTPIVEVFYYKDYPSTPSNWNSFTGEHYMLNQAQTTLLGGIYFTKQQSYSVTFEENTFNYNGCLKTYFLLGACLKSSIDTYEWKRASSYDNDGTMTKLSYDSVDGLLKTVKRMHWRAGIDYLVFRPNAVLMKYYNVGVEFGVNSYYQAERKSSPKGFISAHIGYAIGKKLN
ncbi:MAG: hypothetical protein RL204_336 [Bacteroidota bacterium]|jgi:hypothetical protein